MTLWNITEKKAVWQFTPHVGTINDAKFTPDGKFLMQIGRAGKSDGSNSRTLKIKKPA